MRTLDRDFAIELKMYDGTMNYFSRQIETINRQIEDDRQFFTAEIRSAEENLKNVCLFLENQKKNYEKKFAELKKEADIFSQENRRELKKQSEKINGELSSGNQNRATEILQEYTKKFEERTNFIGKIPRFPINLDDLKKMFPIDTINLPESAVQINDDDDDDDHLPPTAKEIMRRKVDLDDEHDELEDRNINAATSQPETKSVSNFSSKISTNLPKRGRGISSRLYRIPVPKPIVTIPLPDVSDRFMSVEPTSVYEYLHVKRKSVLITFNSEWIVLFHWTTNRIDQWDLASIHRETRNSKSLKWDEGIIRSFGFYDRVSLYIYTDTKFFKYNILHGTTENRILPKTNGREHDEDQNLYRFGTFHGGYFYDAYLNIQRSWILSMTRLSNLSDAGDLNLSAKIPDLLELIDVDAFNEEVHLLAKSEDSSFSVIFCSAENGAPIKTHPTITLEKAVEPKQIFSSFSKHCNRLLIYVNDPAAEIVHITDQTAYLFSYRILAHSIYLSKESNELMLVCDKSIQTISF